MKQIILFAVVVATIAWPASAGSQARSRIVLTPAVELLLPSAYYARDFDSERTSGEVRIHQKPLTLFGTQLAYEPPRGSWRVGVGYARGQSDLKVRHFAREEVPATPGGPPASSTSVERRYARPATRELLTLAATRHFVRGSLAHEVSTALVHQRLHAVVDSGFLSTAPVEGRYSDWGMQFGGSTGPRSGPARGLRIGARVHVLQTSPALFEVFRIRGWEPEPEALVETALAVSVGWRLAF